MAIVCPLCPQDACCHFKPLSPDPYIKKDADQALAKFGHLNHLVDIICCISNDVATLVTDVNALESGSVQSIEYCGAPLPEVAGVVVIPAIVTDATLTGTGCAADPLSVVPAAPSSSPFGMFYGLTTGTGNGGPTDYAATVAPGTAVPFPQNGPAVGIVRSGPGTFTLPAIGTYEINFKVHTTEPGQLQVVINGTIIPNTTTANMNPTLGGHPIVGTGIFVTTTVANSALQIFNPPGNSPALTITPADGSSTHANAQSITIKQIA